MALRDLPDLLLLRVLDPIPRQRNQPLHHQLTMVPRRPTTSNSSDINNQPIQETPMDPEAGGRRRLNSPENDDVAAGEVVAVEAALLHQSALGLLRVEGGARKTISAKFRRKTQNFVCFGGSRKKSHAGQNFQLNSASPPKSRAKRPRTPIPAVQPTI